MSGEKLVEGFNALGFAYRAEAKRFPASLVVQDGEVLLTLLDMEDDAKKFMEFNSADLPDLLQFHSTKVTVNLFKLETLHGSLQLMSSVNTRTLRARRAVVTISDNNYSEINGLRSQLEGFARWAELTGIEHVMFFPMEDDKCISSTLTAKPTESLELGTDFSIAATSGIQPPQRRPFQQEYTFRDIISLRTRTEELRSWEEHQRMHRMIQDLMCLVYNYPCEISIKEVFREDDQPDYLEGSIRKRWSEAKDKNFGRARYFAPRKSLDEVEPLFTHKDVSPEALETWLNNFDIWSRATWIAVETIFQPYLAAESRLVQIGVALEALGYAIWLYDENDGKPKKKAPNAPRYFDRVAKVLPWSELGISDEQDAATWAFEFNEVYKGCKHADNPLPDGLEAHRRAKQGLAVIRCWLAKKLGVSDEILIRNKDRLK